MGDRKGITIFHLVLNEGTAEFNLFAYLTKNKFRELFDTSSTQFSNRVEIIVNGNQIVSQGKLGGVSSLAHFSSKHELIKGKYTNQPLFYFLDKDIDDSLAIGVLITDDGHIAQFIEHNSEHLLLRLGGKNPKNPVDFQDLKQFRDYCKNEFVRHFGKRAHKFKDNDFDAVLSNRSDDEIKACFPELFGTLD